ncbi:MAG: glycosyltransferase family 8 protein [Candidatus Aenigmatarchaeota archaeon]
MQNTNKYIAIALDESYARYASVMLTSLFENNDAEKEVFHVFVMYGKLSRFAKKKIKQKVGEYGHSVSFIKINEKLLKSFPVSHHVSTATYYRLLIPVVIPEYVSWLLYLDCDILVRKNISELWELISDGVSHLAAENPLISEEFKTNLGMSSDSKYFNAGVMLINLKYWRKVNITENSLKFVNSYLHKIVFWDQDILNSLLEGQWKEISFLWNAQEVFFLSYTAEQLGISEEYYHEIKTNPCILHFTGSNKPWLKTIEHPYLNEYKYYLEKNAWSESSLKKLLQAICRIKTKIVRKNVWYSWGLLKRFVKWLNFKIS